MLKDLIALVDNAHRAKGFIDQSVHFAEAQDAYLAITVKALTCRARLPVEVRGIVEDATFLRGASRVEARSTDLLLIGPNETYEDSRLRRAIVETALMSAGVPVLILPAGTSLTKVRSAVVGWDGSGEARRAVRDLMTVIEPGASIDIVSADAKGSDVGAGRSRCGKPGRPHHSRDT